MKYTMVTIAACMTSFWADEPLKPPTPREQYRAILKRHDAPLSTFLNNKALAKTASEPFLKLARKYPGDPASADALNWVVTHTLWTPMAREAMDLLSNDHLDGDALLTTLPELTRLYGMPFEPMERLFRTASEKSKRADVRGLGCLTPGRYLVMHKTFVEKARADLAAIAAGAQIPFPNRPKETDEDLLRMDAEARSLFLRVMKDYADVPGLAVAAKESLAKLDPK